MLLLLFIELNPVKEGTFIIGGRAWGFRGEGHQKKKLDPEGGSTLILKGIKEEQSTLFLTVVCVNVFSYHTDVIFWYFKVSCQSFLLSWQPHSQDPEVRGC